VALPVQHRAAARRWATGVSGASADARPGAAADADHQGSGDEAAEKLAGRVRDVRVPDGTQSVPPAAPVSVAVPCRRDGARFVERSSAEAELQVLPAWPERLRLALEPRPSELLEEALLAPKSRVARLAEERVAPQDVLALPLEELTQSGQPASRQAVPGAPQARLAPWRLAEPPFVA
jgi:hypothetical protein